MNSCGEVNAPILSARDLAFSIREHQQASLRILSMIHEHLYGPVPSSDCTQKNAEGFMDHMGELNTNAAIMRDELRRVADALGVNDCTAACPPPELCSNTTSGFAGGQSIGMRR